MRLHTKILLLMLAITLGTSAIVTGIVTYSITSYETRRAHEQMSQAIAHYQHHMDERNRQIRLIVRVLLESQTPRSLLREASDNQDAASVAQFKEDFLSREVPTELERPFGRPAFQLVVHRSETDKVVASADESRSAPLAFDKIKWPVAETLKSGSRGAAAQATAPSGSAAAVPVTAYVRTPGGLALVLGVPIRTEIEFDPSDAYFLGYQMNDAWFKDELLSDRQMTESTGAPLTAWFVVDGQVTARASSDPADTRPQTVAAATLLDAIKRAENKNPGERDHIEFSVGNETYIGQAIDLDSGGARLILASSKDQALAPLRVLQLRILVITLIVCVLALIGCRILASMISRPIGELVAGTRRIAAAQFDHPVHVHRKDELGALADSFNAMAEGLKERDNLREQRVKLERDMAVARKIQMDVLPKTLPACPGYDIAAFSQPAEQTGGDIYDVVAVALDPAATDVAPSLVLLLADATGHGIGPALSVTQVRSMLRIGMRLRADLENVFAQINRQLCQDLGSERFVTAFLGLLDTSGHHINYHSAGQGPMLHFHAKNHRFEWLDSSMLPLGLDEEAESDGPRTIHVEPGDLIVLLTDGFYECLNRGSELFGRQGVTDIILQHHHRPARDLLNEILAASQRFADGAPQEDDMTGVIIRRLPVGD